MRPLFEVSLMCMDFLNIRGQLEVLNKRADLYHIDIMDGHYCKNITLSPDMIRAFKKVAVLPMDAHLMTTTPNDWIEAVAEAGVEYITPHCETINWDAFRILNRIEALGCKTGVALNPATPLSQIEYYIDRIEMLTIMTVDVGYAGQPFITQMLKKIEQAREMKEKHGYQYKIKIDGSCNRKTFKRLVNAGAEILIVGSSGLFNLDPDINIAFDKLFQNFDDAMKE